MKKVTTVFVGSLSIMGLLSQTAYSHEGESVANLPAAVSDIVLVANRDSSDLAIIDAKTDAVVGRVELPAFTNPHMAMMSMDGKKIVVSGTGTDKVYIIDVATLKVAKVIATGQAPEHMDISHDSRWAYVGNMDDSTVSVIDLDQGKETARLEGFFEPHGFSVLPGSQKVLISSFGAHEVAVLKQGENRVAKRFATGDVQFLAAQDPEQYLGDIKGVANPTLTPDGKYAYAADGDAGEVAVVDTATEKVVKRIKVGAEPWRAYASPDGKYMLVPNNGDETVSVIDTGKMAVTAVLKAGPEMTGVNFQFGEKAYVISSGDSSVYVYDMKSFRMVNRIKIGANLALETAATSSDGKKFYLASSTDDTLYVIDSTTDTISKKITKVGRFPWGVSILNAASPNYCH